MSISPTPSYHLCPDFSVAPPPNGPLDLGSVLKNLDIDGLAPLNESATIEVPESVKWPRNGPDKKTGFSCSLNELRSAEFSLWAKVFGLDGLGGKLGWLSERTGEETLAVREIKTRYFNPTDVYMEDVLASPAVSAYVKGTKKKVPIYMITGIKWVEGASLSKSTEKTTSITGEGGATEPHSNTQVGAKGSFTSQAKTVASFEDSTDFILGFRVRKVSWKRGVRQTSDKVAGAVLDEDGKKAPKSAVLDGVEFADDFPSEDTIVNDNEEKIIVDDADLGGIESSFWVIPVVKEN